MHAVMAGRMPISTASSQVRDATLRESAVANLVDRMRKYEEKMETDVGFRHAFNVLLPAVYRISYEWYVELGVDM
jgi:hypothetical protein